MILSFELTKSQAIIARGRNVDGLNVAHILLNVVDRVVAQKGDRNVDFCCKKRIFVNL